METIAKRLERIRQRTMATTKSRCGECREPTRFSKPSCLMALSTASTWPWCREPFSTISKASSTETSLSPLRMCRMASTCSMGNLDKLASVRLRTFPPTRYDSAPVTNRPHLQVHALEGTKRVHVWGRTPRKLEPALQAGAKRSPSPADLTDRSDVVFLCVTDTEAVEDVVFKSDVCVRCPHDAFAPE